MGIGTLLGCGGGSGKKTYPDAAFPGTGGVLGGGGTGLSGLGGTQGGGTGSGGAIGSGGSSVSDAGVPMPDAPPAPTNTLIYPGIAVLVGPGFACSYSPVATGAAPPDRWCGVMTIASSTATTASMFVFNETKAIAGMPITCTAADPNCITLSTDISLTSDAQHGFNGQTLIYYDAVGVYAWRPGWPAGRKLADRSATLGALCDANAADVPTAICFQQDISSTATNAPVMGFAGSIDAPTGAPLALFEANLGTRPRFSPDGLSVIWSVGNNANTGAGTLKMKKIGDTAAATTV
ncbi:MAG TPA: hypothetical protein VHU40_03495, partial [Polyangia bacterium]|nr:hypothetical protein [Polyangia bacterium]